MVYDILFFAPKNQNAAAGPDFYAELGAVPFGQAHTLFYVIGYYRYDVKIVATKNSYIGRACGVRPFHLEPLELNLQQLYPQIKVHRVMPFQAGMRN